MITNLLFFAAFITVSYLVTRLAGNRRMLRPVPVRIKTLAARRRTGDTV